MMRDSEKTIGSLIDKQGVSFIAPDFDDFNQTFCRQLMVNYL
jgi:hypothetical protein